MDVRTWNVVVVTPNKFEGQMHCDMLRNVGVTHVRLLSSSETAMGECERLGANVIILAMNAKPIDGLEWVKTLRRKSGSPVQKSAVFLTSSVLTLSVAQECRVAGANAVIGLPVSGTTLLNTIGKVLAKPRPFIECDVYAGPCRRAGIVTAGTGMRRRSIDVDAA